MSFRPLKTDSRRSLGARFAYSVRKSNDSANARLRLSISAELMSKTGWQNGDKLRLEVDAAAGLGRLLEVITSGESVRRVEVRCAATGRGHFELPHTGEVPGYFPPTELMTELEVVEAKKDELVFELPVSAKGKGGEA